MFASYSIYWSQLQPEPLTLLIGMASTHLAYEKGARLCAMLIWLASMAAGSLLAIELSRLLYGFDDMG
jgi:hypothetical protein